MNLMKLEEIIDIAMRAGEIILVSGADISRAETTIKKILEAYEFGAEVIVSVYGIFITVFDVDSTSLTRVKRIKSRSTNLTKIEEINEFSRQVSKNPVTYSEALIMLDRIDSIKPFPMMVQLLAAASVSFTFIFFFEGTIPEACVASIIAIFIYLLHDKILSKFYFMFIEYFFASFISAISCSIISYYLPSLGLLKLIIGVMMILMPGGVLANGIKNALNGDIISGSYMFAEALFIFCALAGGTGLALSIIWRL